MTSAIAVENFSWKYQNAPEFALRNVDLEIAAGEFVLVVGPNESGKTTLMMAVKGLIPYSFPGRLEGQVRVFGSLVEHMAAPDLAKQVGYVFADPESQFTALTVEEEILFGLENVGVPEDQIEERIRRASRITMVENLLDKPPYDISGGEKQRVAIAAVLAMEPEILILDEPTAMIDPLGKDTIVQICEALRQDPKRTIIVVEHNIEAFAPLADRIVLIGAGRIERQGPPREFFNEVDFLLARGVQPPEVTRVFARLRREGVYTGSLPLTDDEGISAGRQLLLGAPS